MHTDLNSFQRKLYSINPSTITLIKLAIKASQFSEWAVNDCLYVTCRSRYTFYTCYNFIALYGN